ncbi:MAG: hypothetical protein JXR51_10320 [Bacteroidales bacterium]|nr:hypothetical protein [Bacteroidales bacterium]MBN2757560.1 hypothetical protein [Bacteroidales bacterium]
MYLTKLRLLLISVFIISNLISFSQEKWTGEELNKANTAANVAYLSWKEKQIIYYMNLARISGKKFYDSFFSDFLKMYNSTYISAPINKKNKFLKSLKKDLYDLEPLLPFEPDTGLTKAAAFHAEDICSLGRTGHRSSNGYTISKRGKIFADNFDIVESLSFGFDNPLYIVCQLLLDNDSYTLENRNYIIGSETEYKRVGVSIKKHKILRYGAVIDYSE